MSRYFSFITLLAVIVLLIILFYKVMAGFFVPLFLAALLVVVFRPLHQWMLEKCKNRQKLAALLTTTSILLSVLVPIVVLFVLAAFESQQLLTKINKTSVLQTIEDTRQRLHLTLPEIANELTAVEIQLNNIAEMDRLEDIVNLGWQVQTTELYNNDLKNNLGDDTEVVTRWESYSKSFSELAALQQQIASPFGDLDITNAETSEPDEDDHKSPGALHHDFEIKYAETRERFNDLKVAALGGSAFWIWLREMANPSPALIEEYGIGAFGFAQNFLLGLGKTTSALLVKIGFGLVIMVISLYFFLLDGAKMLQSIKTLSPIDDDHEQELIDEFGNVSRAVVVATLFAALVQAILGGIGYYFAGLDSVFLLTLLTGSFALVPFFGAAAIWVPCVLWLFFVENNVPAAIGLGIWGGVISSSDNFIKPYILHGQSNLHPLFAFLSIIGGVTALGPMGILVGPMVVAFLQTLLKILQRELATMDEPMVDVVSS